VGAANSRGGPGGALLPCIYAKVGDERGHGGGDSTQRPKAIQDDVFGRESGMGGGEVAG
jgi:hypothetical protein